MLEIRELEVRYGALEVLRDVSLEVHDGELVSLIGANGAGKTTLLRAISGVLPARRGTIEFLGQALTKLKPHEIVRAGVSHVPQGRELFAGMTVEDNLELGAIGARRLDGFADRVENVYSFFPILRERCRQRAGTLSGGQQQMVAIARGLMAEPRLLLLDEPSAGLGPIVIDQLADIIRDLNHNGLTVLLVEQNAHLALELAQRAYVIETGSVVDGGPVEALTRTDRVQRAYLGG